MTLSAVTVGALIREQIQTQEEPKVLESIPMPIPVPKKDLLFEDENGVQFKLGSIYMSHKVHDIVRCRVIKKRNGLYKNGHIYPANRNGNIMRPSGVVSNMTWKMFKNNYEFSLVTVETKELTNEQKEAKLFTYNGKEAEIRNKAASKAAKNYHKNVIGESIAHCVQKRNMSIIKDQNLIYHLRESTFWKELGTHGNKTYRFDNVTMASTIWKYRGKWIISSHSAYLKIIAGDK